MLTAAQVTDKWLASMSRASDNYKAGVQSVSESPTQKAAAAADRYVAGVARAVETGKFQNSLQRITLPQWQQAAIVKGAPRLGPGASASKEKMQSAMTKLLPYIAQGVSQLPPRGDLNQNIARATQMMMHMANYNSIG